MFLLSAGRHCSLRCCCSLDSAERKPVEPTGAGGDDSAGSFCWRRWAFIPFLLKNIAIKNCFCKINRMCTGIFERNSHLLSAAGVQCWCTKNWSRDNTSLCFYLWIVLAEILLCKAQRCNHCLTKKRLKIGLLKTWESNKNVIMFSMWVPLKPGSGIPGSAAFPQHIF